MKLLLYVSALFLWSSIVRNERLKHKSKSKIKAKLSSKNKLLPPDKIYEGDLVTEFQNLPPYPDGYEMSSEDICINLREILMSFGNIILGPFKNPKICPFEIQLLGAENPLTKQIGDECFPGFAESFCSLDLVFGAVNFKDELKKTVFNTLKGCSTTKPDEFQYYKCPGLDGQSLRAKNSSKVCSNMEFKRGYSKLLLDNQWEELNLEIRNYREYNFIDKKNKTECIALVDLYDYCIKVHTLLIPEETKKLCYDYLGNLYSGAAIKLYNPLTRKKCENVVLPYFLYVANQKDLTHPEAISVCNNFYDGIKDSLRDRVDQLDEKLLATRAGINVELKLLDTYKSDSESLFDLQKEIKDAQAEWSLCYGSLRSYFESGKKANSLISQNFYSLRQFVFDARTLSNTASEFIKGQIYKTSPIVNNMAMVKVIQGKILGFFSTLKTYSGNLRTEINNQVTNQTPIPPDGSTDFSIEDIDIIHSKLMDLKQDLEVFAINTYRKTLVFIDKFKLQIKDKEDEISRIKNARQAVVDQKGFTANYFE